MEPQLEARVKRAQDRAQQIVGCKIDTQEDLELYFRYCLAKRYNIPIFDKYFDNLTFDQLVFEVFIWTYDNDKDKPEVKFDQYSQQYQDAIKDAGSLFPSNDTQWTDATPDDMISDDDFIAQARKDFGIDTK